MKDWKAACLALVLVILGAGLFLPRAQPFVPLPQPEELVINKISEDDFPDDVAALNAIQAEKRRPGADQEEIQARYVDRLRTHFATLKTYAEVAPTPFVVEYAKRYANFWRLAQEADPEICAAWATGRSIDRTPNSKVHHAMLSSIEAIALAAQAGKRSPVQRGPIQALDYDSLRNDLSVNGHSPEMMQQALLASDTVTPAQACDAQVVFYDALTRLDADAAARLVITSANWDRALFLPTDP